MVYNERCCFDPIEKRSTILLKMQQTDKRTVESEIECYFQPAEGRKEGGRSKGKEMKKIPVVKWLTC